MRKANRKRPLLECLGENSNVLRHKRSRFDNIVLLRDRGHLNDNESERYYQENEPSQQSFPRRILHAGGKRKKPSDEVPLPIEQLPAVPEQNENDIISELTKEFKKARLRPVFFTISSFVQQNVDEVGITLADEPETEVTVSLALPRKRQSVLEESASLTMVTDKDAADGSGEHDSDITIPAKKLIVKCDNSTNETGKQVVPLRLLASFASLNDAREGI